MEFSLSAEQLKPVMTRAWVAVAVSAILGAAAQVPLLFIGFGPVLWSNMLGAGALVFAFFFGRQTWRRSRAGPGLRVVLQGQILSTQWAGEDRVAVSVGPDTKLSERMGWLLLQSGASAVGVPLASPWLKEFKEAVRHARFGDRPERLRSQDPLAPANDRVTPGPGQAAGPDAVLDRRLDKVARFFAVASLVTLGLTVAGGLLIGFDLGLPLFGLFLASAGGFLFVEKGLVPLKTKRITQGTRYTGPTETQGTMAQLIGGLNLVGSVLLALLGVLIFIIGVGAQLS